MVFETKTATVVVCPKIIKVRSSMKMLLLLSLNFTNKSNKSQPIHVKLFDQHWELEDGFHVDCVVTKRNLRVHRSINR